MLNQRMLRSISARQQPQSSPRTRLVDGPEMDVEQLDEVGQNVVGQTVGAERRQPIDGFSEQAKDGRARRGAATTRLQLDDQEQPAER